MLPIVVMMLVVLILAGLVLAYAAFPHRGEKLPAAPWLGEAMGRAAEVAPTVDRLGPDADADASGSEDGSFLSDGRPGFFG